MTAFAELCPTCNAYVGASDTCASCGWTSRPAPAAYTPPAPTPSSWTSTFTPTPDPSPLPSVDEVVADDGHAGLFRVRGTVEDVVAVPVDRAWGTNVLIWVAVLAPIAIAFATGAITTEDVVAGIVAALLPFAFLIGLFAAFAIGTKIGQSVARGLFRLLGALLLVPFRLSLRPGAVREGRVVAVSTPQGYAQIVVAARVDPAIGSVLTAWGPRVGGTCRAWFVRSGVVPRPVRGVIALLVVLVVGLLLATGTVSVG